MHFLHLGFAIILGVISMVHRTEASQLDELRWKNRVLVIVGPGSDAAVRRQREIYESSADGMVERQIVLAEVIDDSERSRQIRSALSADDKRFHVFLVGKDGRTAVSSEKPIPAEELFRRVDAMPMRRDEMRRSLSGRGADNGI